VTSTPAADSTISELPAAFSVTTNEALLDLAGDGSGFALQVKDDAGRYYGDGCLSILDSTLSAGATLGEAGAYTLVWQVISEDGHPVSGEFGFTWAPPAGFEPTVGEVAPPVCGVTGVTPMPTVTAEPTSEPTPETSASPEPVRDNVPLADVLWIGGAIAAVLLAALITFLVLGRRAKKNP
jgi:methionine-rich copper-binding protein CopC